MREINETWTLGGVTIAVENDSLDYPIIRMGRLEPLEHNYSIGHYGGTESAARDIRFIILSGYDDNLIPLVGSGYHALVSDQGAEGNYFITSVRGERLQALNQLSPTFRVTAALKKEPPVPPEPIPVWPTKVYFAAKKGGVYKTTSFTGVDSSVQPVWSRLSTGGSWNSQLRSFGIDMTDTDIVYAITDVPTVIKYSGSTWTTLLTNADVTGILKDMVVDRDTGYMYVYSENTVGNDTVHVYKSDQSTDISTFSLVKNQGTADNTLRGTGIINARNNVVTVVYVAGGASYGPYVLSSVDGGSVWSISYKLANTTNVNTQHFLAYNNVIFMTWSTGDDMVKYTIGGNPGTQTTSLVNSWDRGRPQTLFHPNPGDALSLRFVTTVLTSDIDGKLYTTSDAGASWTGIGKLDIGFGITVDRVVNSIADVVNDSFYDLVIYGSGDGISGNPHTIFVADGNELTPDGKAGDTPNELATTDSIPYNSEGPCRRGIQVPDYEGMV